MNNSQTPQNDVVCVIPDTNIFCHYPQIKDLRWQEYANAKSVRVMICPEVIAELDKHKSDPRLAERAKMALRHILSVLRADKKIREGVTLEWLGFDHATSESLAKESDERIVHSALNLMKAEPLSTVAILSEDTGMVLRGESRNVLVISPDENDRLPNPGDQLEKENRRLQRELQQATNRRPSLQMYAIEVSEHGRPEVDFKREIQREWEHTDVETAMRVVMEDCPTFNANEPVSGFMTEGFLYSRKDLDRYEEEVSAYHVQMEQWLHAMNAWSEREARTFQFALTVKNEGTTAATDVEVHVRFPPLFEILVGDQTDEAEDLLPPIKPEAPQTPEPSVLASLNRLITQPELILGERPFFDPPFDEGISNDGSGFKITKQIGTVKHGQFSLIGTFKVVFSSWDVIKPFQLHYSIWCHELSEMTEGVIVFKTTLQSESHEEL